MKCTVFKSIIVVLGVFFGSVPAYADQPKNEIDSYVHFLNETYGADVSVKKHSSQNMKELELLDLFYDQRISLENNSIKTLLCNKCVCGGC